VCVCVCVYTHFLFFQVVCFLLCCFKEPISIDISIYRKTQFQWAQEKFLFLIFFNFIFSQQLRADAFFKQENSIFFISITTGGGQSSGGQDAIPVGAGGACG